MLAFHNNPFIKTKLVAELNEHAAHDRIVQGSYWQKGKGCAVACTLVGFDKDAAIRGDHAMYEQHLGIPRCLAHLEDRIFEGLDNAVAKDWPLRFANAIQPGADLSMVLPRFLFWVLTERLPKHISKDRFPKSWQSVHDVGELYREWCEKGTKPSRERFEEARANAYAAAAAADAYAYAADAYAYAYAADAYAADAYAAAAYAYAAYAAAAYAAYAYAAYAAAAYAAYAAYAYAAAAASRAWSTARSAEFAILADKLVELLAAAPVEQLAA
jgi:hypothetical protein